MKCTTCNCGRRIHYEESRVDNGTLMFFTDDKFVGAEDKEQGVNWCKPCIVLALADRGDAECAEGIRRGDL